MFVLNPSWEIFLFILYLFIYFAFPVLFIYFSLLKLFQRIQSTLLAGREKEKENERDSACHYQDGINTE